MCVCTMYVVARVENPPNMASSGEFHVEDTVKKAAARDSCGVLR
jgi:hypothetical protein